MLISCNKRISVYTLEALLSKRMIMNDYCLRCLSSLGDYARTEIKKKSKFLEKINSVLGQV